MGEERIERTFETGTAADVSISNVEGTIEIRGWDRPEVQIVAVKHGSDRGTTVELGAEGAQVWAKTRPAEGARGLLGWLKRDEGTVTVDYVARVPYASSVTVVGVSGPIVVAGVQHAVNVQSVNGKITLEDLTGGIAANTVNGSVEGRRLDGNLEAETVSGQVNLADCRLDRLWVESVDGSIHAVGEIDEMRAEAVNGAVELTSRLHPEGRYVLKTVNGSFRLTVPADTVCDVTAEGLNVGVECELPHSVRDKRWGSWAGQVNDGGGAQVAFNTVNGTLTILAEEVAEVVSEPAAPVEEPMTPEPEPVAVAAEPVPEVEAARVEDPVAEPAEAAEPAAPAATKMDVLKAVERGEIAVEVALERLRNLN